MTIVRFDNFKLKNTLSASKLSTLDECHAKYAYNYIYKCPNVSNTGAQRGLVAHNILEILSNRRHSKIVDKVLKDLTCISHKPLWKLINIYAQQNNVSDQENLSLIDQFIITGLKTDFYGPKDIKEIEVERKFDIEVEDKDRGVLYRINGFIDRINWIEDKKTNTVFADVRDYKSSRDFFDKKKIEENTQAILYQISMKYLFPDKKLNSFKFIFLKFGDNPYQEFKLYSDEQIAGYELLLTQLQKKVETFSLKNIPENYAATTPFLKLTRCGKIGTKKNGDPNFICSAYKSFYYYVLIDKDGKIKKSEFELNFIPQEGEKVEKRFYPGCSYFCNKDGSLRNP